jgi:hypothetical protein
MAYAESEALGCGVHLKTSEAARGLFESAIVKGFGEKDMASVIEQLRHVRGARRSKGGRGLWASNTHGWLMAGAMRRAKATLRTENLASCTTIEGEFPVSEWKDCDGALTAAPAYAREL